MGGMGGMGGTAGMRSSNPMFGPDEDDDMDGTFSFGGSGGGMPGSMPRRRPPQSHQSQSRPRRPSPSSPSEITRPLKVSLSDLYTGAVKHLKVGRRLQSGQSEDKVLEIHIQPGWKSGTKIRFARAGNEQADGEAQDLVFVVEEKPHEVFTREGDDLVCRVPIPLVNALAGPVGGGKKTVEMLDGRKLQVAVPAGIVKPGQETKVPGEGMSIRKAGSVKKKGDLIVKWDVVFPERLTSAQKEGIRKVLG